MGIIEFIIVLLSSSAISVIVSSILQKRDEKESRIFNAKFEAYKDFIKHLESVYIQSELKEEDFNSTLYLDKISASVILIAREDISEMVKELNKAIIEGLSEFKKGNKVKADDILKNKIFVLKYAIEKSMRNDLGLKSNFSLKLDRLKKIKNSFLRENK